jgi:hypothetical protein
MVFFCSTQFEHDVGQWVQREGSGWESLRAVFRQRILGVLRCDLDSHWLKSSWFSPILRLLASIALVAHNRAREASRRVHCRNNLRQFGLAALAYEGTKKRLPPGTLGFGTTVPYEPFFGDANSPFFRRRVPHTSFQGLLLPYMEQRPLYDSLGPTLTRPSIAAASEDGWFARAEGFVPASINAPAYTRCPVDTLLTEVSELIMFGTHPVLLIDQANFRLLQRSVTVRNVWQRAKANSSSFRLTLKYPGQFFSDKNYVVSKPR